jgi:hypothetical protein
MDQYQDYVRAVRELGLQPLRIDEFESLTGVMSMSEIINLTEKKLGGDREKLANGTMMASEPDPMVEKFMVMESIAMEEFGRPLKDLDEDQIRQIEEMMEEMTKKNTPSMMMAKGDEDWKDLIDVNHPSFAPDSWKDLVDTNHPSYDKSYENLSKGGRAGYNQGGRIGLQTGGTTDYLEQRNLPPEFIEAAQRTYLTDLATQAGLPSVTTANVKQPGETDAQFAQRQAQATQFGITKAGMADLAPQVAAQDALQTQAYNLGQTGLGSFQPFLTDATTAAGAATDLTGTGAGTGAGSIESYMSPYQQQVIDTTMQDFDRQAQIRANQQAAAALGTPGAFGGGREGVQRAEYQAASDQNRAQTLANLRQSGFQNAAARRQQDLANQMGIANLQGGLGARAQDFSRAQISGLGTLGAAQQSQQQAVLDAQRQAAQMAIQEPRQALDRLGQGIAGITPGAGGVRLTDQPAAAQSSPLMQALGIGLAGADIYGRIF